MRPRLVLATCILASSLAFIDGSVVNVGLPAIGRGLHAEGTSLSWAINGYLLPLSALLLIGGAAGDLYGRRLLLIAGTALFAVASALCGLAQTFPWLVAGRALQGIGAAVVMPNSLAILGASFEGEERGRAVGTWAAVGAAAGALGPLFGGWLIDVAGWRPVFFINLPIAAVAIHLAARYLPAQSTEHRPPLDMAGAALAAAALGSLTWGLTVRFDFKAAIALAGGAALLVAFVAVEKRKRDRAMMPLTLFSSRAFVGLNVLTLLLYAALGGILVLVPFVLIEGAHESATLAGASMLPLPALLGIASPAMGRLGAKVGPKLPLTVGSAVAGCGFALAARIGHGSFWSATLPAMLIVSLGMATAVAPLTTAVLGSVAGGQTGIASGFNSAVARTGGLVATALFGTVLAARGERLLPLYRTACFACAAAAAAASASALLWLNERPDRHPGPPAEPRSADSDQSLRAR